MLQPDADLRYEVPSAGSREASKGWSEAEGGENELERGGGGGEEGSTGPSGTRGRGARGRVGEEKVKMTEIRENS